MRCPAVAKRLEGDAASADLDASLKTLTKVNDILTTLKNEGFISATHKKWFGTTPPDTSSTVKVMPVPKL